MKRLLWLIISIEGDTVGGGGCGSFAFVLCSSVQLFFVLVFGPYISSIFADPGLLDLRSVNAVGYCSDKDFSPWEIIFFFQGKLPAAESRFRTV